MPCCYPVQAFKTGYKTVNGKDEYIRCHDVSYSGYLPLTKVRKPVKVSDAPTDMIPGEGLCLVDPQEQPCGNCVGCRMDNAFDWVVRCSLELQDNKECYFVTLTYDWPHLPFSKKTGSPVLHYKDVQKFFKRLRLLLPYVRYYGCGEYGKEINTMRPHYHVLIYGHLTKSQGIGVRKWLSSEISECWPYGQHVVEDVCPGNIAYTCGYVEKKQADPDWDDYEVKPFTFMSTKPAIGAFAFLRQYETIKETKKVAVLLNGSKAQSVRLPRYFKRLLEDEEWFKKWKEEQKALAQNRINIEAISYRSPNRVHVGSAKESAYYSKLEKRRKKSI